MIKSNKRKAKLLGMSFGAAGAKLRKEILFHLAKKLNLDTCYRCKKKITKLSTFSIDHKKSWIFADDPVKIFFDLENIAFSHIRCNSGGGKRPTKIYRDAKERHRKSDERYRAKHRKEIRERHRLYRAKHIEEIRIKDRKRYREAKKS